MSEEYALDKKNEVEHILKQIENNISQLRMRSFDIHLIGVQLAEPGKSEEQIQDLKTKLDEKYQEIKDMLNNIFHEDEDAEHLLQKIRDLI